jgi:hypothetical protein
MSRLWCRATPEPDHTHTPAAHHRAAQASRGGTGAGRGVFQHLLIADRIAERGNRPAADHHMDALDLFRVIAIKQKLRRFGQEWLPVLIVTERRSGRTANHMLRRNAINALGVNTHEILAAASDDVGLKAVSTQVPQHLLYRLVS